MPIEQDEMPEPSNDHAYLRTLRIILVTRFSKTELRDLCFDLGVPYDDLPGEGKANKARELVDYLNRRGRVSQIAQIGQQGRPDISWQEPSLPTLHSQLYGRFLPVPTEYERLVGELIEMLLSSDFTTPPAIEYHKHFIGLSGQQYEIDLSYVFRVAEADYLTLVHCSNWNEPIRPQDLRNYKAIVDDVNAHKGILVTSVGVEAPIIEIAKSYRIGLFKVSNNVKIPELKPISHFKGPTDDIVRFLRYRSSPYAGGKIEQAEGIVWMNTHVIDYIADRYGLEVAAFLAYEPSIRLSQLKESDFKTKVIQQVTDMGPDWIYDYYKVEACGFPLSLEPALDIRLVNIRASSALHEIRTI